MNRIDRLFAILLLLQHQHPQRAMDLANLFEVTERTIYRDMQALMEMGVPLVSIPGVGYDLLDTFRLPPVMLTEAEATALFLGGQMLITYSAGNITAEATAALQKLMAILPDDTRTRLEQLANLIEFFPLHGRLDWDTPHLTIVLNAIEQQQVIRLSYRAYQQTETTTRNVEPHFLTFSQGAWYLNGYCRLRQAIRSFRLNRITDLTVTPETFTPRMVYAPPRQPITIRIQFAARTLPYVREKQHYAFERETEDGIMIYQVDSLDEIKQWVFGFGVQANVLEPPALRQWILDEAKSLIKLLT